MWMAVCFLFSFMKLPLLPLLPLLFIFCLHTFSSFLAQTYLGKICKSEREIGLIRSERGASDLLRDISNFLLWKADYSMIFSQTWYRHPLWDFTLSLLVSRSKVKVRWLFCLFRSHMKGRTWLKPQDLLLKSTVMHSSLSLIYRFNSHFTQTYVYLGVVSSTEREMTLIGVGLEKWEEV